jgi:hypothetical protein
MCHNYDSDVIQHALSHHTFSFDHGATTRGIPASCSQEIFFGSAVYDDDTQDEDHRDNNMMVSFDGTDAYQRLVPKVKELANLYQGDGSANAVILLEQTLNQLIATRKAEIMQQHISANEANQPIGQIVSCNVLSNKRRKTHGTKYM